MSYLFDFISFISVLLLKRKYIMELSIKERMMLSGMMPENSGSLAERREIRNLMKILEPTKEELESIKFKQVQGESGNYFTWDSTKEKPLVIDVNDNLKGVLKEILKDIESEKRVNDDNFELLDKIDKL